MAKAKYIINGKNELVNSANHKNVIYRHLTETGLAAVKWAGTGKKLTEDNWSDCGGVLGMPFKKLKQACREARTAFVQLHKAQADAQNGVDLALEGRDSIKTLRANATEKVYAVVLMLADSCHSDKKEWQVEGGYKVVFAVDGDVSDLYSRLLRGKTPLGNINEARWTELLIRTLVAFMSGEPLTEETLKDEKIQSDGKNKSESAWQKNKRLLAEAQAALESEKADRAKAEAEYEMNGKRSAETISALEKDNQRLVREVEELKEKNAKLEASNKALEEENAALRARLAKLEASQNAAA